MHRVDDRRIGPCLDCIAELDRKHEAQTPPIERLTEAQVRILNHRFHEWVCPVCGKKKQSRQCFCKGCYHALKTAKPELATGLYVAYPSDEFYENYARAKAWLSTTGLQRTKNEQGGLFA
jgi:hypothetical protein